MRRGARTSQEQEGYATASLDGGVGRSASRYVLRVTGGSSWARWMWQGTVLTLLGGLPTVWGSVLRGRVYRIVLGKVGPGCFIERGVDWQVPRQVFLGARVMIGKGCFIDAHSATARIELADDVWLSRDCYLVAGRDEELLIGDRTYVGHRCLLYGHGGIEIGRDVLLASDVQLICGNHTFARRDIPIRAQSTEEKPIVIGDDVWLGASAIVLGGVTVGEGSVVGAGAVVTRSLPPYSIARGVPAQVVGTRGEEPASSEDGQ